MSFDAIQKVGQLSFENGRMRSLLSQAVASMENVEIYLNSKETISPEGRQQWYYLIERMRAIQKADQQDGPKRATKPPLSGADVESPVVSAHGERA